MDTINSVEKVNDKTELRNRVGEQIRLYLEKNGQREFDSKKAVEVLVKSKFWQEASSVFLFSSTNTEIDTSPVVRKGIQSRKSIFFPRITGPGKMVFLKAWDRFFSSNKLPPFEKNKFGIKEPPLPSGRFQEIPYLTREEYPVLVLVPGRAFTGKGERLGMGGGYYDRYLKVLRKKIPRGSLTLIGYCFGIQVVDFIPVDAHDMVMDKILTPDGFIL